MKKIKIALLVGAVVFVVAGCGQSETTSDAAEVMAVEESEESAYESQADVEEESVADVQNASESENDSEETSKEAVEKRYADSAFLEDFSGAIQARWKYSDDNDEQIFADVTTEEDYIKIDNAYLNDLINIELDYLQDYQNAGFEDRKLQEYAVSYLNCLKDMQELIEEAGETADATASDSWRERVLDRAEIIADLYDDYGLRIDTRYSYQLHVLKDYGYINKMGEDAYLQMLNPGDDVFSVETNEDGHDVLTLKITNTSEYVFEDLLLTMCLSDDDGNIIEQIDNTVTYWGPGDVTSLVYETSFNSGEYGPLKAWVLLPY